MAQQPSLHPIASEGIQTRTAPGPAPARFGCTQCRRRRVKCDKARPCSNCVKREQTCQFSVQTHRRQSSTISPGSRLGIKDASSDEDLPNRMTDPTSAQLPLSDSPQNGSSVWTGHLFCGQDDDSQLNCQLLRYYMINTAGIVTNCQGFTSIWYKWRYQVIDIASSYDYLMHAILCATALQRASLEPMNQRLALQTKAISHLRRANDLYRRDGNLPSDRCADARFLFEWLMVKMTFAFPSSELSPVDAIALTFRFGKNIKGFWAEKWHWLWPSDSAPVLQHMRQPAPSKLAQTYAPKHPDDIDFIDISYLDRLHYDPSISADERRSCIEALDALKRIYDMVRRGRTTGGDTAIILAFAQLGSSCFPNLIERRAPPALIILAHYCVLLHFLSTHWWVNGWGRRLLQDVLPYVSDDASKRWLKWPVHVVLSNAPDPTRRPSLPMSWSSS